MAEMAAVNIFMEWKVFDKIPETGSISCKELAESIGAEYNLIGWSAPPCTNSTVSTSWILRSYIPA